jgi:hypothetical protein
VLDDFYQRVVGAATEISDLDRQGVWKAAASVLPLSSGMVVELDVFRAIITTNELGKQGFMHHIPLSDPFLYYL